MVTVISVVLAAVGTYISVGAWLESDKALRRIESLTSDFRREANASLETTRSLVGRFEASTDTNLASMKDLTVRLKSEMTAAVGRVETIAAAGMYSATSVYARERNISPVGLSVTEYAGQFIGPMYPDTAGLTASSVMRPTREPAMVEAMFQSAMDEHEKGNYQRAMALLDTVILENPKAAGAYINRGWAKAGTGDWQGAIDDYTQATMIAEDDNSRALAYNNRGIAEKALRRFDAAEQDYVRSAQIDPSVRYMSLVNLAILKRIQGLPLLAESLASAAIALRPDVPKAYFTRGAMRMNTRLREGSGPEGWDDAVNDYSEGLKLDSLNADALFKRGYMLMLRGDNAASTSDLNLWPQSDNVIG